MMICAPVFHPITVVEARYSGAFVIQTVLFFIGSFIVALILLLIVRKAMDDEGPHWAVVLLIMVIAGNVAWFGDAWAKDRATRVETAAILARMDENPVVSAMKATDPSSYAKIVKGLHDSEEAPKAERAERFRSLTEPTVREFGMTKIRNMNDDVAVKFGTAFSDVLVTLGKADAFKNSIIHSVLRFILCFAFRCVFHRS